MSSSLAGFSRPCPKNGYYDIFLSFRGKDTRHGFTNNLYHSLQQNGVYTFMDTKLVGEDIDYLFEVIAKSRMAVVIYSKNFPSSDWCLRELELILQLRREKKMLMIPIFYNIDLHELKHLTGDTAKYIDTHILKHSEITVQKWKDAVTRLGHVSGLSYKDTYNRSEYDFIKDVTGRIKEKLRECEEPLESCLNKLLITIISCCMNDHPTIENSPIPQLRQEHIGSSTVSFEHTNTTTGQEVVSIKPTSLNIIVEPNKPSSTCLILSDNTDNYVALQTSSPRSGEYCSGGTEEGDVAVVDGGGGGRADQLKEEEEELIISSIDEQQQDDQVQHRQEDIGSFPTQSSFAHTITGDEEQVYRVVTSTYFQKSYEYTGKLLSVKPDCVPFIVEPEKESSTLLIFSNITDNYVAFLIQCTTEPLKYRVCPSEGLVLPRSTCQVLVTMEAQSTVFPSSEYVECREKIDVWSVIAKNGSYNSTDNFSDLFKKESENYIDKWWMNVLSAAQPKRHSSVPDHHSQLVNKGFLLGTPRLFSIDTHPIKPWLLLGLDTGSVCIWNYETRVDEKLFKLVDKFVVYVKFIHEKQWFVAGDSYGLVHVFDYNTSEKVKEFKAHEDGIRCMAVHPTSPYVLTTSNDKLIKLWNWKNEWARIETFEGHSNIVKQVVFNPKDSRSFASASLDGTIKLWSFDSSVAEFTINAHTKWLSSMEYFFGNNDKLYLLSGCDDNSVRVWDYESKTLVKTLEGHSYQVHTTLVHPKLPIIITGSLDKTIRIWNKHTYRLELVWNCDLGQIWSMGFIKTSDEVVLRCDDGIIVIKIVNAGTRLD